MPKEQTGHHDAFVFKGEELTDQGGWRPSDLVDLVVWLELAAHRLHHPIADASGASLTVGVAHIGELLRCGASQSGLLTNFPKSALECGFASAAPSLGQRPVLAVRSVDDEQLVMVRPCRTPHDSTGGLDHSLTLGSHRLRIAASW